MSRIILRSFRSAALAALGCIAACSDDKAPPEAPQNARFLLTSALVAEDVATSHVVFLDSLEQGDISLDGAREFNGFITTVVRDGFVFIAEEEAPIINRYEANGGSLENATRLSFSDYGVASLGYGLNFFASSTRAYVASTVRERVVWNPKTMEIEGTLELDLPDDPKGFELNASYERGMTLRDGHVFQSIYAANWDDLSFAAQSHVAVWSSDTDKDVDVSTADCPMLDVATQDDEGNIYFSNWVHAIAAQYTHPDDSPDVCAVRIPAGSTSIDPDWTRKLSDYTDGRPVMNLHYAGDGQFVAAVFYEEHADSPVDADQVFGAHWRVWRFDLEAESAEPIENIEWNDGGFGVYRFENKTYIVVTTTDGAETFGYQLDQNEARQVFRVTGSGYQISQL